MAWYDEIANTTKGNVQGLINALRNPQDAIVNQFKQGALYKNKEALAALVRGDTAPIMNSLNTKYPVDPNEALGAAMMLGTIKSVGSNIPLNAIDDYAMSHRPPMKDYGAPLHDLTKIYPDDIYSNKAVQYYGTGDKAMDTQTMGIINAYKDKPNAMVKMYRAIPNNISTADQIKLLENQKAQYLFQSHF
jgi:hypothetical protein